MTFSNEQKFLLYCSQARISKTDLAGMNELSALPLDWHYVFKTAMSNGVAPLLYHHLRKIHPRPDIPSKTMAQIKKTYLGNTVRNMISANELIRLLGVFSSKGIDTIVLKGAALANAVYPESGLRVYGDIDILIKSEDRTAVEGLMPGLRYAYASDPAEEKEFWEKHYHLPPYRHLDANIFLDVHLNVTNTFQINIDHWWERSRTVNILGCWVRVLSPHDLLQHLFIHTSKHGFNNIDIRDLCDISECIKYYGKEINWTIFQKEIDHLPIRREVYATLYFIKRIFCKDADDLNWVIHQNADLTLVSVLETLIFSKDRDRVLPGKLTSILAENDFKDKLKTVIQNLFPDREFMLKRYSLTAASKKIYFYYSIRPLMQIIKNREYIIRFFILKIEEILQKTSYALRKMYKQLFG